MATDTVMGPSQEVLVAKEAELGRDCAGRDKSRAMGLKTTRSAGLVSAVSGEGHDKWPIVSKTEEWQITGMSGFEARETDWGRSEKERRDEIWGTVTYRRDDGNSRNTPTNKMKDDREYHSWWYKFMLPARTRWLEKNPTWWEEKRREAEIDASPQVAGEMTDMGIDNRSIVAGHLAKTVEGSRN